MADGLADGSQGLLSHDFPAVVTTEGRVYNWGPGDRPKLVAGLLEKQRVADVACSGSQTIALTCEGEVFAWELNVDVFKPESIIMSSGKVAIGIAASLYASFILMRNGRLYSSPVKDLWRHLPVLGSRSTDFYDLSLPTFNIPPRVGTFRGIKIKQVAAGDSHCLALSKFGRLFGWGGNDDGQIQSEKEYEFLPKLVFDWKTKVERIAACRNSSAAHMTEG